jgi:uncharacterized protein (DUF983 family)
VSEQRGPVGAFMSFTGAIFAGCFLLWLAVQLLQAIWVWLLVGAAVAAIVTVLTWLRRRDRSRW